MTGKDMEPSLVFISIPISFSIGIFGYQFTILLDEIDHQCYYGHTFSISYPFFGAPINGSGEYAYSHVDEWGWDS